MTLFEDLERAEALALGDDVVDLFAGPGGWDVALAELGVAAVGIEFDRWACATRRAAGHPTLEADVAHLDPADFAPCSGVIASPPCQALSNAGSKIGHAHLDALAAAIRAGDWTVRPHPDPRVWLALEVGRWVEQLEPEWVALEQVPAALPLWHAYAEWLTARGYSCWVGKLNAADYGVPQIRHRAVLIASRARCPGTPPPTHAADGAGGLARWRTMAAALGWGMTARPAVTVAPGTGSGGPDPAGVGGSHARAALEEERDAGRWLVGFPRRADGQAATDDGYRARDFRRGDQPAFVVTEKARSWTVRTGTNSEQGGGATIPYERDAERPSGTLTSQARCWVVDTGRDWAIDAETGERTWQTFDPFEQPALAFTTKAGGQWVIRDADAPAQVKADPAEDPDPDWPHDRPATTVAGDPRIFHPGGHAANDGRDNSRQIGRSDHVIRIEVDEALVLQGFPRTYPVKGGRTKAFEQIGNAIPPPLALAVLREVLGG